jgi:chemotaxis protein methyltransferase CheR
MSSPGVSVSAVDFDFVCRLVYDDSAVVLREGKEYLVEARLAPVLQREGIGSIADLIGRLRNGDTRLRQNVVEAMFTHETSFFRDVHPFDALRQTIIPEILRANGGRRLALWCAAAATGQEPYSLAMLVREHFPSVPDVTILATDLSRSVLARAEAGIFTQIEVNRGLPAALLVRYFERKGTQWQVKQAVRATVSFSRVDITKTLPPGMVDVVLLRNVLIYFDAERKKAVLRAVAGRLRRPGYLILGAAETTYGLSDSYEKVEVGRTVCYRLTEGQAQP